jgi:glucose-6-phosphate dehydrogenase assembly protein OpcA
MLDATMLPSTAQETVPLTKIKSTLTTIWQRQNEARRAEGKKELTRSSVMTLVAFSPDAKETAWLHDAIAGLTGQHPSRAIILADNRDGTVLQNNMATVEILTHSQDGTGAVGSEIITLPVPEGSRRNLAPLVTPLLLPDMPIFVWWSGGLPTRDETLASLLEIGDYSIFDSADFDNPNEDLVRLADLMTRRRQRQVTHAAFNDFNWTRIKPWRELAAQCFDPEGRGALLRAVDRVAIEYAVEAGEETCPFQAYLFAGWLASRLGWQQQSARQRANGRLVSEWTAPRTGQTVTVDITPRTVEKTSDWREISSATILRMQEDDSVGAVSYDQLDANSAVSLGALMRVTLTAHLGEMTATFDIARDGLSQQATSVTTLGKADPESRHSALDSYGEAALLHQQLTVFNYDHVYEDAILAARTLVSGLSHGGNGK